MHGQIITIEHNNTYGKKSWHLESTRFKNGRLAGLQKRFDFSLENKLKSDICRLFGTNIYSNEVHNLDSYLH